MPIVKVTSEAQIVERIDSLLGYIDGWTKGELTVRGKDGLLNINIEVKAPGKKNGEQLDKLGGLLQEIKNMIHNREYYLFEESELKGMKLNDGYSLDEE